MFPTPSRKYLAPLALSALLAGCSNTGSSIPSSFTANAMPLVSQKNTNALTSPDAGGMVLYESSLDGGPAHGQVLGFPSSLNAKNPNPIRTFNDGTVRPYGMWVDTHGNLWVANIPQGAPSTGVFAYHPGASHPFRHLTDQLVDPTHVAVGADGTVYVNQDECNGKFHSGCITVFAPGSNRVSRTIDLNVTGYALQAGEMAFDKNGNLLVVDSSFQIGTHVIQVSTQTFKVTDLNLQVSADGPGLAVDGAGNLYVGGENTGQIEVFAPGATSPSRFINGSSYDLAVKRDGTLYANNYGEILEWAPGATNPTNQFTTIGNDGLGVAIGPAL